MKLRMTKYQSIGRITEKWTELEDPTCEVRVPGEYRLKSKINSLLILEKKHPKLMH